MQLKISYTILFLLFTTLGFSQIVNDDCISAIELPSVTDWCSNPGELTTVGSTASGLNASCFPNGVDVFDAWFSFTAIANTINISVIGNVDLSPGGTLVQPQLAVYSGDCINGLNEVGCFSDGFNNGIAETFITNLTPGVTYFIQVSARGSFVGTYQLCLNNFNAPPEPEGDCISAAVLCDKSSFSVEFLLGGGNDITELADASCLQNCGGTDESSSAWYKWTCDQAGTLTFTLTPNSPQDDLDFVLYELPNGIDDCNGKEELRCMASGENVGEALAGWVACTGSTGIGVGNEDTGEGCGCAAGDNNFVAPINMEAGKSYALIVSNFSDSGSGFSINWGGTGTFLGPDVDFALQPDTNIECDESVAIVDASAFGAGSIVGWSWSFGAGAIPANAFTPGPHNVEFASFGPKLITLTVESDGGCFVTKTIPLNVRECCIIPTDLEIQLVEAIDPLCAGEASGMITVEGFNGDPDYTYSLNNGTPRTFPVWGGLTAGTYEILIQDIKGCQSTLIVTLNDPPAVIVDAGPDITVNLGEEVNLTAVAQPAMDIISLGWSGDSTLTCFDCPNPTATPFQTTQYTATAINDVGCEGFDNMIVEVRDVRPIYIPNVISPNNDGNNDLFHIFGNAAAVEITEIRIFNRWGAVIYEEQNLPLGQNSRGWDGTFKGQQLTSDVFAFYAIIRFIDDKEILYEGDITIMR